MEESIKTTELIKSKGSRKFWTIYFAILALIFATGKSTNILTTQKIIMLTGLWSVTLVGTITLRSRTFNLIITNNQYYKLDGESSSRLLRFLDVFFFFIVKGTAVIILKVFAKVETKNAHLIPKGGAIIIAPNHSSYIDTMILQATFPRRIIYMLFSKHYKTWGKWLYKSQHAIPVKENGVNGDALKRGLELLSNNGTLGIFPEGKLAPDGNLQEGKHGVGFLAIRSKATIVPVFISGAFDVWPEGSRFPRFFRKIDVIYGNPIYSDVNYINGKISREKLTNKVMDEVKKLSCLKDA